MRRTVIALAAAAALIAGSTITALAHGGGHGGGGGGGHGGGFGGGHMGGGHMGFSHAAFAHSGGFGGAHAFHFRHDRDDFRHHRFFRRAFFDTGYPYYAYDDSCRVWTRWGWRWVCNY